MYHRYSLLLLLLLPATLHAQTTPSDTVRVLPEATVIGYGQNLPLRRTAAAVGVVNARVIGRFNEASLAEAVNTVPGVRLEERATASYRLNIRGSSLRSPYGVRNVKVYYNDIPFTDATGSTALNLLDAATIGRIEVLKGPAGSVYGAGTGGVALLSSRQPEIGTTRAQVGFTTGSYGLRRYAAVAESGTATSSIRAQYVRQTLDGYRQQSALRRDVVALDGEFRPSAKQTIGVHVLYTDIDYELPGGLTRAQFAQDPRQARPSTATAAGSVAQNTFYASRTALLGVSHEYRFTERFSNKTTLYTTGSAIRTAAITDYERNAQLGGGGRTTFNYRTALAGRTLRLTAGGELQTGFLDGRSFQNLRGRVGALRYNDEVRTLTGFGFAQADYELPADFLLTVAASYNRLRYRIARVSDATTNPDGYELTRTFRPEVSPRVALLKQLTPQWSVYGSVSTGYAPPTTDDIRTSDGSLNRELQAERGTSYEVGTRGSFLQDRLTFDIAAYDFHLDQTIVTRTTDQGVSVFYNAGTTRQRGVEATVSGWLWRSSAVGTQPIALPTGVRAWASYAYQRYRFGTYESGGDDFSGNRLTGTAPHTLTAGLDATSELGFYLYPTVNHQARLPLNDANTEYATGYWTFGSRAGWRRTLLDRLEMDVFAGVNNLTDRNYSLGNDLNAFGGRYFQPANGRNWYGGATVGWRW
ncbi:TonB-dependent receptor plug domain-containing protein [Hymenobacter sp. NBH84]|uniref:TonB-dependent receptor family protein n=1 Tax=Hymenobacter sp. NBH84 TaxID=2596915 RepID=UPI0016291743|nr:TonB-dependent receptor [Hymenobacter sp. NBH84]QNE38570.1 TonB-dependent receptor plug domain-containing protein [Hymenobacter sp. NBH84]